MTTRAQQAKNTHYCGVDHSDGRTTAWARCSCGWLGPVRGHDDMALAYEDQETHLSRYGAK